MNPVPQPRALYIDDGLQRVFAIYHAAAQPDPATAVLLCPPFGWEDICSYRSRRQWAEQLVGAGNAVLRLDLPGSGDSPGGPRDADRFDAWVAALLSGGRWLRHAGGAQRIALVGIGLTGMAAVRAALDTAEIDELVLWGVPAKGRTVLRELRAFARMELANVLGDGEQAPEAGEQDEDALVVNGYLLSASTVDQLEQLDLTLGEPAAHSRLTRVLLLERDGLKADDALRALLEERGAAVTLADGAGYGEMMRAPQDAVPPAEVFELSATWLAAGGSAPAARAANGCTPPPLPTDSDAIEFTHEGVALTETPLYVEREGQGRLFGILSEPIGERAQLCAVLVNAGPQRHTGPNRMWVEIARRWTAMGVPVLRIDLAGIGDSDGDSAALVRVAALYAPDYVTQTLAVLDALAARGLPQRFVMLGLCSGAYWSAHAALEDERVAGTVMLNPRALIWDEWRYTVLRTRDLRERLLRASTWRRVLRGEITLARHMETARSIAQRGAESLRGRLRPGAGEAGGGSRASSDTVRDPVDELLDALRERDQRALLLLTGREPLREEFDASGLFERAARWPNLRLEIRGTSADTHTLTPLWLQRQVHELVDDAIRSELKRL